MRKRIVLPSLLLIVLTIAGTAVWLWCWDPPGVTLARFNRIEEGMTQHDVELLIGRPPSDISPGGVNWGMLHNGLRGINHTNRLWCDDECAIRVDFDEEGRVANKRWVDGRGSVLERVRRWVGL
jgi:hypothetical protein